MTFQVSNVTFEKYYEDMHRYASSVAQTGVHGLPPIPAGELRTLPHVEDVEHICTEAQKFAAGIKTFAKFKCEASTRFPGYERRYFAAVSDIENTKSFANAMEKHYRSETFLWHLGVVFEQIVIAFVLKDKQLERIKEFEGHRHLFEGQGQGKAWRDSESEVYLYTPWYKQIDGRVEFMTLPDKRRRQSQIYLVDNPATEESWGDASAYAHYLRSTEPISPRVKNALQQLGRFFWRGEDPGPGAADHA